MGSDKFFIHVIRCVPFKYLLKNIKLVSCRYCILIAYITICKYKPVISLKLYLLESDSNYVILRTGTVIKLQRSQGERTFEHISCQQSLGKKVWRSKMSRTSHVQAEGPVEKKRDFNIITRELSRVALLFHWWASIFREPSNWFHQIFI